MDYTHIRLNEEIEAIAGYYTLLREEKLKYQGREIFYVVGSVNIEKACCGARNYSYVLVPGYIAHWQKSKNQNNLPVSEVEPIKDPEAIKELTHIIQEREGLQQIDFW